MTFLNLASLTKIYEAKTAHETTALDKVSLTITKGDFMSISGPSGSGKTTLLNMIGCLDKPDSGSIVFNDETITSLKDSRLAQIRLHDIGFVFQAYNLIPVLTAMENIEYILMVQGVKKRDRQARVRELAQTLDIEELLHKRPDEMSGGQQQRVTVARAVASKPQLVLADEPTANLDSENGDRLMALMAHLNQDHGITFIFATHDSRVIEKTKRHIQLEDGRLLSDSTPST